MKKQRRVKRVLRVVGLTNLEADVCVKLLEMKQTRVTKLARKTGVTRTQLYPLLEKLLEKGFVKRIEDRPTIYSVVEPEKIAAILERWIKEQTALIREAQKVLKKIKR
ncbi:MAG: helix-turn-helix domain-containing protein [Candidatus Aenigmatarchaeota archaeon]